MKTKIITFFNNKGGVLKTTLATNLASFLSLKNNKVLLIDTDTQRNVLTSFGITSAPVNSLNKILSKTKAIDECVISINDSIDVISINEDFEFYDKKNLSFKFFIEKLKKDNKYDYIVIDTEPKLSKNIEEILLGSENVLIPFSIDSYSLQGLNGVIKKINYLKNKNPLLQINGFIATKIISRSSIQNLTIEKLNDLLPEPKILNTKIPNSIQASTSILLNNKPLLLTKNKSTLFLKLNQLFEEILEGIK